MTEQQSLIWLLSMPACAEVNETMQELTGLRYNTGEQNQDITKARKSRDWKDTTTVLKYLQDKNRFTSDSSLRNISTGVHAHSTVNVDHARDVGKAILEGNTAADYTFKRSDLAVTLCIKSAVKISGVLM